MATGTLLTCFTRSRWHLYSQSIARLTETQQIYRSIQSEMLYVKNFTLGVDPISALRKHFTITKTTILYLFAN